MDSIAQANKLLPAYTPSPHKKDRVLALDSMKQLMHELGDPQERLQVVHIAGTSGKTSTAYYVAHMLQSAGKRVGLTVSPHVDSVTERVQLDGKPLPAEAFYQLLKEFASLPAVKRAHPGYFGLLVAFAYWVFARKQVDYAVVEVGMGGLLDATNVVRRPDKVCIITDIGMDHTEFLGTDLASIAAHKGGIIQPDNQVFVAEQTSLVVRTLQGIAQGKQATLWLVTIRTEDAPQTLPLFQRRNWLVARAAYDYIARQDGLSLRGKITTVQVPARMEAVTSGGRLIVTDGAHNAQKITALCAAMRARYGNQSVACLISLAQGKDTSVADSMRALRSLADTLIITTFRAGQGVPKRAIDPAILEQAARTAGFQSITVVPDPVQAFRILQGQEAEVLLVTGSFYLLNHIRPLLHG